MKVQIPVSVAMLADAKKDLSDAELKYKKVRPSIVTVNKFCRTILKKTTKLSGALSKMLETKTIGRFDVQKYVDDLRYIKRILNQKTIWNELDEIEKFQNMSAKEIKK